jgi:transposase
MDYWAKPGLDRRQTLLLYPTLDDCISAEHPVRMLDEILQACDWSAWEAEYHGGRGQPPIPPRIVAGAILYGLMRRIRSGRQLEYACGHHFDFLWLVEGRSIDHDTFCKFRTRFKEPLKKLFKEIGRVAMHMGLIQLVEVAFDGTRVKANASRFQMWTAAKAEAMLSELERQAARMLDEAEADDASASSIDENAKSLSPELADPARRREKLLAALGQLRTADAARKRDGIDPQKTPAQLAPADPEARLMPNKEGGYAPNYTPTAAVDGTGGFIVDCDVIDVPKENGAFLDSVDRITENFERSPSRALADGAFGTIVNLKGMETRQIDFYTPVESPLPEPGNPALREDPSVPVPEADWPKLPRNANRKLAKSCFLYDETANCYHCPLGKILISDKPRKRRRAGGEIILRTYRCHACANCPLASVCLDPKSKRGRTVSRDGSEFLRAKMATKLNTESGRKTYHRRLHIAETPFAILKGVMGIRQFLLRGLEKVRTEWLWACTAYNLKKLLLSEASLRAPAAAETVPAEN